MSRAVLGWSCRCRSRPVRWGRRPDRAPQQHHLQLGALRGRVRLSRPQHLGEPLHRGERGDRRHQLAAAPRGARGSRITLAPRQTYEWSIHGAGPLADLDAATAPERNPAWEFSAPLRRHLRPTADSHFAGATGGVVTTP